MIKIFFILLFLSFYANSQTFESKRDLLNDNNKKNEMFFSVGAGFSYANIELVKSENSQEYVIFPDLMQKSSFCPNIFLYYKYNESSDFTFRLNLAYLNTTTKGSMVFLNEYEYGEVNVANSGSSYKLVNYDIDLILKYDILGFKNVSAFGGFKTRFQNYTNDFSMQFKESGSNAVMIKSVTSEDNNTNFAILLGAMFNGSLGVIDYEIYFQYNSLFNNLDFKNSDNFDVSKYKLNSYGLGLNLIYRLY